MDILEILQTIKEDWPLLAFVFTLGGAWWQGKAWFKKLEESLAKATAQHGDQTKALSEIHTKLDAMDARLDSLETSTTKMHEELHEAEVKLAVLQNTQDINEGKPLRRKPRRKVG
jgi:septal ring factor EnvC (AmiA/AmiB activator)